MSQDNKENVNKDKGLMMKISLVSLLTVLLFIVEIYEIINDPGNLIAIGSLGVFILASVYAETLFIGRLSEKRVKQQQEAFDNVYRSEKASYLLMRKYFDQMEQKMESLNENAEVPFKELISAQKALAKAQINRNKQNANAVLISNDKIMHKLTSFQKDISNTSGLSDQDRDTITESNKDILANQQEILSSLKELEITLRNEILESVNKMASMKSQHSPMDMAVDSSFDDNLSSNQILDNSSESDLDKLLMEMEEPAGESGSIEGIQFSENDFDLDSAVSEPEIAPLTEEPMAGLMEEPVLQPVSEEPVLNSVMEEPELSPILDESVLESMTDETELNPVMESIPLESTVQEPELLSLEESSVLEPIAEGPELAPIMEELPLEPIAEGPELAPIMEELPLEPIAEEPELAPIMEELPLEPITEGPELAPIMEELPLEPITEEPELEPIMEENLLSQQLMEEEQDLSQMMENVPLETAADDLELAPLMEEMQMTPEIKESEIQAVIQEPKLSSVRKTSQESDLDAMIAGLGITPNIKKSNSKSDIVSSVTLKPQSPVQDSSDEELEQIMKAMDINDITEETVEDLDIDKILEVPLSGEKGKSSDFSQVMSSEEIAALIAKTELLSASEEKEDDLPDLSDPSYVMSSEEIAALIANM